MSVKPVLKKFALTLHVGSFLFFLVLLTLVQDPQVHQQYPTLAGFIQSYAAAYNLGEVLALITLLSVSIPSLFNPQQRDSEDMSPRRLVFLALMLMILCVAYSVRTPIPPDGYADELGIGYQVLSKELQFASTYIIGMCTAILGIMAVYRIWPRTLILLSMLYLLYFFSGEMLFNLELQGNHLLSVALISFTLLLLGLGLTALAVLRPPPASTEAANSEALYKGNTLRRHLQPDDATATDAVPNSANDGVWAEMYHTRDALRQLRTEIDSLRQEHQREEIKRLESVLEMLDDVQVQLKNKPGRFR